jgi:hypothetical protein
MLFSVGYTLQFDRSGVIFSLSQVKNFLGDEGDLFVLQKKKTLCHCDKTVIVYETR